MMKPTPTPPPAPLSADELRIAMAYRAMDQRRKRENMSLLEDDAIKYPHRKPPALSVVQAVAQPAP